MRTAVRFSLLAGLVLFASAATAAADGKAPGKASYAVRGKHFDAGDVPTYRLAGDGSVDWYTATGHGAYHSACQSCHGPRGTGSGNGSALAVEDVLTRYFDFTDTVVNGGVSHLDGVARLMPAYGTVPDVMCRLDAIFVYLRAEYDGVLSANEPLQAVSGSAEAEADLQSCLGQ